MTNKKVYPKSVVAQLLLRDLPPLVQESLLSQQSFVSEFGFKLDATINFGDSKLSFKRSVIYKAIRKVLRGQGNVIAKDLNEQSWELNMVSQHGLMPNLVMTLDERIINLPSFAILSPKSSVRLADLQQASSDSFLPANARQTWGAILKKEALDDNEVDVYIKDFQETPISLQRLVHRNITSGECSISSLIPASLTYYERLVGIYDGSQSVGEYASSVVRKLFKELTHEKPHEGFLFCLYLSSHTALTAEIAVDNISDEELTQAYQFIEEYGDILSKTGAVELGLRILKQRPHLYPFIIRLVNSIKDEDIEDETSGYKLFSALFVLVDGELSRLRLMASLPVFYRRLASLAHAALLQRQINQCSIDQPSFCQWALNSRLEQYYMQIFADMRTDPRWHPDLISPHQLKAEAFGRIMNTANLVSFVLPSELHDLILGDQNTSLKTLSKFPFVYFPGPLEGAEISSIDLPKEIADIIEAQLISQDVGPDSFIALVNSVMVFKIETDQAELAAKSLKLGNHRLRFLETKGQLIAILMGLAEVAAVSKSQELAEELRILVRRYRHDTQFRLSIDDALKIGLIAAASNENLMEWVSFLGLWITELAFGEFIEDEGAALYSHLRCLLLAVPELWISCGKAEAALKAYCDR